MNFKESDFIRPQDFYLFPEKKRLSRREFIKKSATVIAGGVAGATFVESSMPLIIPAIERMQVFSAISEQKRDWEDANLPDDEFLAKYKEPLKLVTVGTTFSAERAAQRYTRKGEEPRSVLTDLGFLINDVGFKNIRAAFRWNSMVDGKNNFDSSRVKPVLDFLMGSDAKICIGTGIKSAGWPEQFPPEYVLEEVGRPNNKTVIHDESDMAKAFKEFLPHFFSFFKSEYKGEMGKVEMFQLENEPFQQFGKYEWTMSYEYLASLVGETVLAFPDKKILFNSAGFNDLGAIKDLLVERLKGYGMERFVVGSDFYPFHPDIPDLPIVGKADPVVIAKFLGRYGFSDIQKDALEYGFDLESTELQGEPWGEERRPGNDVSVLKYNLIRHMKYLSIPGRPSVARWWGGEYLADQVLTGKVAPELKEQHRREIYIIQSVNSLAV